MPSAYTNGLRPEQIDDLVNNTLHKFDKDRWTDISLELQQYFAYDNMLLGERIGVDGGDQLQWQVKVRNTGSAKNTGMYAVDDVKVSDVSKSCLLPWTKQTCNMGYDVDEPAFNTPDAVRILALIKLRRHDALTSYAELMEQNFWGYPANLTDESELVKPRGVPYWIVKNSSKGFEGLAQSGHTTVAGLNPSTYNMWRNWTDTYKVIDKHDLVRKLREACTKCKFKAPVPYPSTTNTSAPRYVMPTTYEVISKFEEIVESQNSNLGNDIASKDGQVLFRRTPFIWVPYLDNAAGAATVYGANPIYGINKDSFSMVFKRGSFMRRSPVLTAPEQHTVRHIHWDTWMQFRCVDRRGNFHISQV